MTQVLAPTEPAHARRSQIAVATGLAVLTLLVFARTLGNDFVNYDDPDYVTGNLFVQRGLDWPAIQWAFGSLHGTATYWHPITWLSHMLDFQLFGLRPIGHHATSLVLHTANVVLLFTFLFRLTGALWRSAFVAAVFAIHPLQVDTVAWITERKNVLSGLFWLLTLLAYLRYVRKGTWGLYGLTLLLFAMGLMCKPVLVTLPFVMLLLDVWPLRRWSWAASHLPEEGKIACPTKSVWTLVLEKIPFIVLSVASSAITVLSHEGLGISQASHGLPLELRLENAFVSYGRYLEKLFLPAKLAVLYPHPGVWPSQIVWGSFAILAFVTVVAVWQFRQRPYFAIGWFWFLGVLFPAIGVMQIGIQAMADRFIYLPMIGLLIAITWFTSDEWSQGTRRWVTRVMAPAILLVALGVLTWIQIGYWKNSQTLWEHTLAVTGPNAIAHNNLAYYFLEKNHLDQAEAHARKAIEARPDYGEPHLQLGMILEAKGQPQKSVEAYRQALRIHPNWPLAQRRFADALATTQQTSEAITEYERLLTIVPGDIQARLRLAQLLSESG
jgi:protein O-mannosyl-transferase